MGEKKQVEVDVYIEGFGGDYGVHGEVQCPDCGVQVKVAEYDGMRPQCHCRYWTLEVSAFGVLIEDAHNDR